MENSNQDFKIISQETIYKSKNFRVEKRIIQRNGMQITKDFIVWNPIAYILPVTKNKEIYLEYQFRDAYQKTMLEIVAGHVDPGEDILKAAKRELKEETGLTADKWQKIGIIHPSANIYSDIHVFVALELHEGKSDLDDEEEISLIKLPLNTALEKAFNNEIEIGTHQAVLFKLDNLIQKKKIIL